MIRNEEFLQLREAYIEIGKMVQKYGYGQYNGILRILMGQVNCIDSDENDGKKMKYLTADLLNWYISNHNVACPKNDGGDLKGILGKYGPCVRCSRGHFLKPEEI